MTDRGHAGVGVRAGQLHDTASGLGQIAGLSVRIPSRSGPIVDIGRNKQIDTAGGATRSDIEGNASDRSGTEGEPASGDGGHICAAIDGDISL